MESDVNLPDFRYHPDPLASGSVVASKTVCLCCQQSRGFIYTGPSYAEEDRGQVFCPWCIASGAVHQRFGVEFVDSESLDSQVPGSTLEQICGRTPGYDSWNGERWPVCCGDACAFIGPMGIAELRSWSREAEGLLMSHVVHGMGVSGGAALRLVSALRRDHSPTLMVFRCLACEAPRFHVDAL
jgi:uncharacterized protein CbrC (UPF0167 family)